MAYDPELAERIRSYLFNIPDILVEEKKMFGGLAFMVNGKMCVNASKDRLMCRFDPSREQEISHKTGYQEVIMKGRVYRGYCYVQPEGFEDEKDFKFWIELCLDFNAQAKSSKK